SAASDRPAKITSAIVISVISNAPVNGALKKKRPMTSIDVTAIMNRIATPESVANARPTAFMRAPRRVPALRRAGRSDDVHALGGLVPVGHVERVPDDLVARQPALLRLRQPFVVQRLERRLDLRRVGIRQRVEPDAGLLERGAPQVVATGPRPRGVERQRHAAVLAHRGLRLRIERLPLLLVDAEPER